MPALKVKRSATEKSDQIRERLLLVMKSIMARHPDIRTRAAFAESIYTTSTAISRWENQEGMPTLENIADTCEKYNVSEAYVISGKGNAWGDAELLSRIEQLEKRVANTEKKLGIKPTKQGSKHPLDTL